MKKILLYFICVTMSLCHSVTAAHAQSTTLSITPPVVEILIAPGKKVLQTFTFKAEGEDLMAIPEIHLGHPQGTRGHITIDQNPYKPSDISLSIASSHPLGEATPLKNGELTITLTFEAANVDVAEDIYLVLVIKTTSSQKITSSSLTLPGISALIFTTINPSGVTPIDLNLNDFDPPILHDSWNPITISPSLKNNVPIMLRPRGKYEVINPSGRTIFELPLYPNLILGESTRSIDAQLNDQPVTLSWQPTWKNIGPYRLRITITTEGGSKIIEVEKPLWILPIRGMIVSTLILLFLMILFIKGRNSNSPKLLDTST